MKPAAVVAPRHGVLTVMGFTVIGMGRFIVSIIVFGCSRVQNGLFIAGSGNAVREGYPMLSVGKKIIASGV